MVWKSGSPPSLESVFLVSMRVALLYADCGEQVTVIPRSLPSAKTWKTFMAFSFMCERSATPQGKTPHRVELLRDESREWRIAKQERFSNVAATMSLLCDQLAAQHFAAQCR
jgi:hypothetical protein